MIRILINHDVIRIPQPIIAKANVIRRHIEIPSAKPESARPAAHQPVNMLAPKRPREMPMLPRMIEMVVRIVRPSIMPNPFPFA